MKNAIKKIKFINYIIISKSIDKNMNLNEYLNSSNANLEKLALMVRKNVKKMTRITIEALLVLDVHGKFTFVILRKNT
jgi:hypothetical protein